MNIETEILKIAKDILSSTSAFMAEYKSKTFDNPIDSKMRIWSYSNKDESMPIILTEMYTRKWNNEDAVWLSAIVSPEGKGMASYVLKQITKLADKHQLPIYLVASPIKTHRQEKTLSKAQLMNWYKRHGWEKKSGDQMVRIPQ